MFSLLYLLPQCFPIGWQLGSIWYQSWSWHITHSPLNVPDLISGYSLERSMTESQLQTWNIIHNNSVQHCFHSAKWPFFLTWLPQKERNRSQLLPKVFYPFYFMYIFLSFLQMTVMWPKHQQEKFTHWECKWHSSDCFGYGELPKLPLEIAQAAFPPMGLNEISCIVLQPSSFLFGCKYWHKLW